MSAQAPWDTVVPGPQPTVDIDEFLAGLARVFVPLPERSWEQALRHQHGDLQGLDDKTLWREKQRAAFLAAWLPKSPHRAWCEERLRAMADEEARRRKETNYVR
jgi:hypothetical protein